MRICCKTFNDDKTKSVPKARTKQTICETWQEFLSLPVLIAQILCAVEVKKSSVALGVAYTYATPLPLRRFFYLPLQRFFYSDIATSHAPQMTVRKLPTFALSPTT